MSAREMTKKLEEEISNKKATEFFGEDIVKKLEIQHQDGYPYVFERLKYTDWQYGSDASYKVIKNNKEYVVKMTDNVLRHPLYINVILGWEE